MSERKSPKEHVIRDFETLAVLRSPHCARIVDLLEVHEELTVKELAAHLDRLPESLYYHVKKLVRAGLLHEAGTRKTARKDEVVYRLVGTIRIDGSNRSEKWMNEIERQVRRRLREIERDLQAGFRDPERFRTEEIREVGLRVCHARLDEKGLVKLTRMLRDVADFLSTQDCEQGRIYSVTTIVAPRGSSDSGSER